MNGAPRTLAGRYELAETIGRGGMGTVYRATDMVLGRSVAVKILPGQLVDHDPTSIARFEREARAAAALSHPAVVAVYDTGVDETSRFIVMEYIAGHSLEAIVRDDGPLDPVRAAGIAARVADALAAAHAAGIVHRDIKPANVMIADDGSVKVLDFGIARAMDGTTLTQNDSVLGTATYMSPEQALGKPADERSDIYSLGCVLYTLLAGHSPFRGEAAAAILNQHATTPPPPLPSINGRVPAALEATVMRMLAKAPGDRPQTAAQVRDLLARPITEPPATAPMTTPTAVQHARTARPITGSARPDRRKWILASALAAIVLVIAVIALSSGGGSPHATTTAQRHAKRSETSTSAKRKSATTRSPSTTSTTSPATSTPATTTTATTAATPTVAAKPRTVPEAAGTLTTLSAQDVQSGTIDQQAGQQISNGLMNILNAWDMGNAMNAQQQLTNLSQQVAMLEQHGDITSAATPGINHAVANLGTALASSSPPTTTTGGAHPPAQTTPPAAHPNPGHGGQPPGQAKHPGAHH